MLSLIIQLPPLGNDYNATIRMIVFVNIFDYIYLPHRHNISFEHVKAGVLGQVQGASNVYIGPVVRSLIYVDE